MSSARTVPTQLRDKALRWIADDPEAASRVELQHVLADALGHHPDALAELEERMSGTLTFGTAGLRGPVRAGPNGMNVAVVVRTTAGVSAWLREHGHAGGLVVLGRDARHGSDDFAAAAAEVLTAAGFQVRLLPRPAPTPLLAFAVGHLGAAAGIQITASHNPPADNGYKLYDHSGAQIIPPADAEIEAQIEAAPAAIAIPRASGAGSLDEQVSEAYLARCTGLPRNDSRSLRIAATALHGVGADLLRQALEAAGFTDLHLVPEQTEPDPDFPTVSFPNPEEPGATDLLLNVAARVHADLAIALDPDADRCALGVADATGRWRMLRGDEAGVLLGEHLLSTVDEPDPLVATTIVSSSMLGEIARSHGARYAETLTGFKWLIRAGAGLVYAYEEALGLCVNPGLVRDKDGIAAAVAAADLAATRAASGSSLLEMLDELTVRHGVYLTEPVVHRVGEPRERTNLLNRVRTQPPATLAGTDVATEDLVPDTDGVRLHGDQLRVIIRDSGTEPKVKAYLQVTEPVVGVDELAEARTRARRRLDRLRDEVTAILQT